MTTRRRAALGGLAFFVVTMAVQLLREPGRHVWDTIWADDGYAYVTPALHHPWWRNLGLGYMGYIQVVPHLLAAGIGIVPVGRIAAYIVVASAVVMSLLGLVVVRSANGWIRSPWLRWGLGVMMTIGPAVYFEINVNLANLAWPLLVASFWVLASRHEGAADMVVRVAVVVLTALTTTVGVVLLPWAAVVLALRRRLSDAVVTGALVTGLAVQVLADRVVGPPAAHSPWATTYVVKAFSVRVLGSLVLGERWLPHLWIAHGRPLILGSVLVVVVVVAVAVGLGALRPDAADPGDRADWFAGDAPSGGVDRAEARTEAQRSRSAEVVDRLARIRFDRRWVALGALASAVGTFVVTSYARGPHSVGLTTAGHFEQGGSRYAYVPIVLILSGLAILIDSTDRRWLTAGFTIWMAFTLVTAIRLPALRSNGPSWTGEVAVAEAACAAHPEQPDVNIVIVPGNWWVVMPCSHLR